MQEDKTSKWLASLLRKQQEEDPLPYELGAWEAFEAKRVAIARKKAAYWISGIAASLTLLLVVGGLWFSQESGSGSPQISGQLAFEEKSAAVNSEVGEQSSSNQSQPKAENPVTGISELNKSQFLDQGVRKEGRIQVIDPISSSAAQISTEPIPIFPTQKMDEKLTSIESAAPNESVIKPEVLESLIATQEKIDGSSEAKSSLQQKGVTSEELPKEPQLSEKEIEEILKSKSFATLAMGVSPGFGTSQGANQTTSGASLGLGVMVNMEITGKLVMGSGLAVNYLNQASESQSYAQVAGFSSPVTEKNEIAQVQVDIPLYFKYPITNSQSISVQAGFSNLITFNQAAETELNYTRQVAVMDGFSSSNSFTLKSESVNQAQALSVPDQKFFPFATANLGINIRLFESKKTSYEVMPFYNYPLQEFSGYGEKLGMFGASFKVNFGAIEKK